jgi:hypothetical protein
MVTGEGRELCQGLGKWGRDNGIVGEINFSFPCLYVSRGRKSTVLFKTTLFHAFFLIMHETTLFYPKRVVSFKRKGNQNVSIFKSVLNFRFVQSSPQLQF